VFEVVIVNTGRMAETARLQHVSGDPGSVVLNPGNLFPTLDYEAAPGVREAIASLGRTEDIRFSPGRNRLAFAGFGKDKIVVFEIGIER